MKILAIEPTPSPNTMKITLDQALEGQKRNNYTQEHVDSAPEFIQKLLQIDGVKGVYHVADFIALDRNPKVDWKQILPSVREVFGESVESNEKGESTQDGYGEVKVFIQVFSGIPMQVKLSDGEEEKRVGLPERFQQAVMKLNELGDNVVMEREWKEHGVRYGEMDEIGEQIVDEIAASYNEERIESLLQKAANPQEQEKASRSSYQVTLDMLDDPDWKKRYAALEQMNPTEADLPVLEKALTDEKQSIRRLAVVYLGMIGDQQVLPVLTEALIHDKSVMVRRTAGDCFSDIGDPIAIPAACKALEDKSKLVRWRAAMFLYEVGDESAVPALKKAVNDPEFEVAMQVQLALERIEGGEEAKGSVWKQMTETMNKE